VQISRLAEYAACKGLAVNVDKCALMVCNDKRLSVSADQVVIYQGVRILIVDGFKYLGLWMDRRMNMKEAVNRTRGSLMAAWRELVPVAGNAGVRYSHMPCYCWLKRMFSSMPCLHHRYGVQTFCILRCVESLTCNLRFYPSFGGC
jgi:hypothetical protein